MTPYELLSESPARIRFKRCPACGDIALLSCPICSCCDRTFVTTARYARQKTVVEVPNASSISASPYLYSASGDFVVLSQRPPTALETFKYNPLAIVAAGAGLGWLGMIVNGQTYKGLAVAALFATWALSAYFIATQSPTLLFFVTVSGLGGYLVALTDVICIASKHKAREKVDDWEWF